MRQRVLLVAILLFAVPFGEAAAAVQREAAPGDADARSYWHALQRSSTAAEVAAVPRPARLQNGSGAFLAEGMHRLRRYELGGSAVEAARGRRALERAVEIAPRSAWAHFALGALLARGPDLRIATANGSYFIDPFSNAALQAPRALRRALELDRSLTEAALELGRLALDLNTPALLLIADSALRAAPLRTDAAALLLRSRIAARKDTPLFAAALADSARAYGLDTSIAAHEQASSLFRVGGEEQRALAVYLVGITQLSAAGATAYFRGIEPILTAAEVAEWQQLTPHAQQEWLRRFWRVKAALAGTSEVERIGAHFRRLHLARTELAPTGTMGAHTGADESIDPRQFGLTPAGLLHVRHGDVLRAQRFVLCGADVDTLPPLLQPSLDVCALRQPPGLLPLEAWQTALRAADRSLRHRQLTARAQRGESYYPPFQRDVPVAWELYRFRGAGGLTDVVAAVAAPVSALPPDAAAAMRARMSFIVLHDSARTVQRQDDVTPQIIQRDDVLWTSAVAAPAGSSTIRVSVADAARVAGRVSRGVLTVRSFASDTLALSDVVFAPRAGPPTWRRGAVALTLTPHRDYARAETFELFYEVYGLAANAPYRTEIIVAPQLSSVWDRLQALTGRTPDVIRLRFEERAPQPHEQYGVQQLRSIDASALAGGDYRLRVTITQLETGQSVSAQRSLVIR